MGCDIEIAKSVESIVNTAETRALASGQALNELIDYLLSIPFQPCAETTMEVSDVYVQNLRSMAIYARGSESLTAAREVLRKAEKCGKLRCEMASATDLANSWAREIRVEESKDIEGLRGLIDRIWAKASTMYCERDKFEQLFIKWSNHCNEADMELASLRTERDELAALLEKLFAELLDDADFVAKVIGDPDRTEYPPDIMRRTVAEFRAMLPPTTLANLKAQVRREVLEEAAKYFDDCWSRVAAELRRMAGEK
jgi:hypothetical protein